MIRKFRFGEENLNGTPILAVFDEKNLTTDWLTDFLFDGNAVVNSEYSEEVLGFVRLNQNCPPRPCLLSYSRVDSYLRYDFPYSPPFSVFEINEICEKISQYFADSEYLDIDLIYTSDSESDGECAYDAGIILYFYHRT